MKNIVKKITEFLMVVVLLSTGCQKITTEGVTGITHYPKFEMTGDKLVFVQINTTFTDPGVIAFEGDTEINVDIKGAVNTSVKDVYTLVYTATNSDGFPASIERMVAVVPNLPTVDLAGTYSLVHATRTGSIDITKIEGILGYYRSTDSWWQAYPIPLDFVDMGDGTLIVLPGSSRFGPHAGTGTILPDDQIQFACFFTSGTNAGISWSTDWQLD